MIRIFAEAELSEFLERRIAELVQEVRAENRNALLNANESQYVTYLVNKYRLQPPALDFNGLTTSDHEELVPADRFPRDFAVTTGDRYSKQVVRYHIPFSGDECLLRCKPSSRLLWTMDLSYAPGQLYFDIVNWRNDPEEIKRGADRVLNPLRQQAASVAGEVTRFNDSLEARALEIVQGRKGEIRDQLKVLTSLGVPLKKSTSVPETFSVPITPKAPIIKPASPTSAFTPEPVLDASTYDQILKIIRDFGVAMERLPSLYRDREEEALRDLLILVLAPHFQSVTGETFNRSGKTDILVRHEGKNVFVAECKFWAGIEAFYDAIDQALGYLTWRDSKAALVCFVRNKELNPVLEQIRKETAQHPCFVKSWGEAAEGWFRFEFHLPKDSTRGVRLAVMCFHFPEE